MGFVAGNKLGKNSGGGRPKNSKSLIPLVRDLILNKGYKRAKNMSFWKNITDVELLKAMLALMPRENKLDIPLSIVYRSTLPSLDSETKYVTHTQTQEESTVDAKLVDNTITSQSPLSYATEKVASSEPQTKKDFQSSESQEKEVAPTATEPIPYN